MGQLTFSEIGSTREVCRALKNPELLRLGTLKHLSCSPNFLRALYLDKRTLTHEAIRCAEKDCDWCI